MSLVVATDSQSMRTITHAYSQLRSCPPAFLTQIHCHQHIDTKSALRHTANLNIQTPFIARGSGERL